MGVSPSWYVHLSPDTLNVYLNDGVDRTGLLTEAAVDTLGHVDVVSRGPPATVRPRLRLYRDGLWNTQPQR